MRPKGMMYFEQLIKAAEAEELKRRQRIKVNLESLIAGICVIIIMACALIITYSIN